MHNIFCIGKSYLGLPFFGGSFRILSEQNVYILYHKERKMFNFVSASTNLSGIAFPKQIKIFLFFCFSSKRKSLALFPQTKYV